MAKPSRSALRSGLLTGVSTVAVSGSAAVTVALLGHEFGRTARTDGLLTAYGVYLVIAIAAQAFRTVVLPELTRAAAAGRDGAVTRAYGVALAAAGALCVALAVAFAGPLGDVLTGRAQAASVAADALPWLVAAGFLQLLAGLGSSALAARDDYGTAALAYALGAVAGLVLFAALAGRGLVALAWGVCLNGALTAALPLLALARAGALGGGGVPLAPGRRLALVARGAAVPVAVQGLYVVSLRLASGLAEGRATTLSYAYLLAAVLVQATASSVALVSSAPLTRRGLDARAAAAHVVHSAWLSLVPIAAAAGVFALVGGRVVAAVLGSAYSGEVGRDLGRLVVELVPWTVVTIAYTLVYPLLFVVGRVRPLVPLALAVLALHAGVGYALREAAGLAGIAAALALTTAALVACLLAAISRCALALVSRGLVAPTVVVGALAGASFGALSVVGGAAGAAAGLALYVALVALVRPRGLRAAWAYVRTLH